MGGCLDKTKPKKMAKTIPSAAKLSQSSRLPVNKQIIQEEIKKKQQVIQKYRKMTINQLLTTYKIQQTLNLSSKMQGPKYLSNYIDGSSKVLRVINLDQINQKRLQVYKKILSFQTYQNQQGTIMIIDEYCAGCDIYQLIKLSNNKDKSMQGKYIFNFFQQIVKIIYQFHKNKIWLGNLNLSSFRKKSVFDDQVRLVDINLYNQVSDYEKVGFAHKQSFEADNQFIGYLLQFILCEQSPIFIPHKIQYIQFESIPYTILIQKLLKGYSLSQQQISSIKIQNITISNKVLWGYIFRRDINKLLKMRKKRRSHNKNFYGQDVKQLITEFRFQEDAVYRYEAERIFNRIKVYIQELKSFHEQPFINYSGNNENLRRMKEVFLLTDKDKKMAQLKECLSTIK